MSLNETEAIILRSYNLAEADKIVVCLTRKYGVVRAVARGAKRLKSKYGASLEPFTVINLSYYEREGRELVSLRQVEILRSYFELAAVSELFSAMSYMCELVIEFTPPHEPNETIFRMLRAVLDALRLSPENLLVIVRYFEIWILKLAGFFPDLRGCDNCGKKFKGVSDGFFNSDYRLRCADCSLKVGRKLSPTTHSYLLLAQKLSPSAFANSIKSLPEAQTGEIANLTQSLITRALEREPRTQPSLG